MRKIWLFLSLSFALVLPVVCKSQDPAPQPARTGRLQVRVPEAQELFGLANNVRAEQGLKQLEWDPALASAALQHCLRMVSKGEISHQFEGEPDLNARAGDAGAKFSQISENVATGLKPATIQLAWLESPGHRANLLNPDSDHVGMAVVSLGDTLYAVADFTRAEPALSQAQVEEAFATLLRAKGLEIYPDPSDARAYCAQPDGTKYGGTTGPNFLVRWQGPDTSQLPPALVTKLDASTFHQASVGNCPPQNLTGSYTLYRVAILFYQ
jgi:uncharacterized protein YkwD